MMLLTLVMLVTLRGGKRTSDGCGTVMRSKGKVAKVRAKGRRKEGKRGSEGSGRRRIWGKEVEGFL